MSRKLDVVILACRQAVPDPTALANPIKETGFGARVVSEPCSSKVEVFQMLRSLASEADLLWVVGCPEEACQLVEGSFRMGKRVAYAQDYLKEIGLEPERLGLSHLSGGGRDALAAVVSEIQDRARKLGPNPARVHVPVEKEQP